MNDERDTPLWQQLAALSLARLFLNTGLRMVYPFAPALARGLGVPLSDIYRLITIRNFTGILSPLFGPLSDRFGRKPVIIGAMIMFSLSSFLVVIWPLFGALGLTLSLISLAKVIYDPATQAYIGDRVPYRQRGRAVSVVELAWAGSLLLGAPLVGLAIQAQGWSAPFLWMGVLSLGTAVLLWRILPHEPGAVAAGQRRGHLWRTVRAHPVMFAGILYTTLAMTANEIIFIVYGDWMESSFNLALTNLGLATAVIGGSEILGEITAGFSVDRFGKRPVIIITGLLNALAYFILPYADITLTLALITLFFTFIFFEITFVGGLPLLTEVVPAARGTMMAMALAGAAIGRAIGSSLGPLFWRQGGLPLSGLAAGFIMLAAVLVLFLWIREGSEEQSLEIGD